MELDPFTLFVFLVAIMLVAFLVRTLTSSRRSVNSTRECKACGATQPGFAKFCRRCGRAL